MTGQSDVYPYEIEFYEEDGDEPVLRWMRDELDATKRRALGLAMRRYLQALGTAVTESQWGKALGEGLYEFRLRYNLKELAERLELPFKPTPGEDDHAKVLLRVFFHQHGGKIILLLGGYDKGEDPSEKRQSDEIKLARKRLKRWKLEQQRAVKNAKKQPQTTPAKRSPKKAKGKR